jgi:flagellar basal-body rod protein FlgB
MFPTDLTIDALAAALRGLGLRHQAIAQNVANADTPGYQRVDVHFESELAQALGRDQIAETLPDERLDQRGPMERLPSDRSLAIDAETQSGMVMRADGGAVDPDTEMAEMAANQLAYQTVTSMLGKKFGQLSYVINGR